MGGGCWPTEEQKLLLEAAVLDGERAQAGWASWNLGASIDDVEWLSFHLLPQVYANLQSRDVKMPNAERLKGTYRYTWYKNNRLMRDLSPILHTLNEAGIKVVMLRDVALAHHYYGDYGRRPISEIHMFVRQEEALRTLDLLVPTGDRPHRDVRTRIITTRSSARIGTNTDPPVILHWRSRGGTQGLAADNTYWDAAISTEINGNLLGLLSPTDQLHDVSAHGVHWNVVPPTLWIVDALTVLKRAEEDIDWERLVRLSTETHTLLAVRNALAYIRDTLGAPVSQDIIERMQMLPISERERAEYESQTHAPALQRRMRSYWYRYEDIAREWSAWKRTAGVPAFLQHSWELEHLWQIVPYAGRFGMARLVDAVRLRLKQ